MPRALLAVVTLAALAFGGLPVDAASAGEGARKKCEAPGGTRAPIRRVRTVSGPSCSAARKVARAWDRSCEPLVPACRVQAAGQRWSCRSSVFNTRPYRSTPFVKCALKETARGRPTVTFRQPGAVHPCSDPSRTRNRIFGLYGIYEVRCARAGAVARAWDSACRPGEHGTECAFTASGRRWTCRQVGDPGRDSRLLFLCAPSGRERTAVQFRVDTFPA